MNLDIYNEKIRYISDGVFWDCNELVLTDDDRLPTESPLFKAFLEDDDLQEMTICSSNIGFVKTFRKRFKKTEKPPLGEKQNDN